MGRVGARLSQALRTPGTPNGRAGMRRKHIFMQHRECRFCRPARLEEPGGVAGCVC